MTDQDDLALIRGACEGNQAAFTELVGRHKEKAVQLAYSVVGNYEDARDVAQEAFVKAHKALDKFEGRAKFTTWFYRILMNTAKDHHRRRRWTQFMYWQTQESMDTFFERIASQESGPAEMLAQDELGVQMSAAIRKLPFKQQWIFTLRYLEGMSIAEIMEATGLAEGTVKSSLHFAAEKFKHAMMPYLKKGSVSHG